MSKISVDAHALRELLSAIIAGGPRLREIEVTRGFPGNPLDVLLDEIERSPETPSNVFLLMGGVNPVAIYSTKKAADQARYDQEAYTGLRYFRVYSFPLKDE